MSTTGRLTVTIAVTAIGASFQFYNYGVVNNAQGILQRWMNETYAARNPSRGLGLSSGALTLVWSFFVACFSIGALIGSILTRSVAENLGRRNGLILSGVLSVVGAVLEATSKPAAAPELLMAGRFICGLSVSLNCGLAPLYLTEIAPTPLRGTAGTAHQIAVAFGDWFSLFTTLPAILGTEQTWPYALVLPALPAAFLCLVLPFAAKSPKYLLITLGDTPGAQDSLVGFHGEEQAAKTFGALQKEAKTAAKMKVSSKYN